MTNLTLAVAQAKKIIFSFGHNSVLDPVMKALVKSCLNHPIFIVGTGRSGTSVLLQALGKHPNILAMTGEAPLLTTFGSIGHLFEESEVKDYYNASLRMPKEKLYQNLRKLCFESAGGDHYAFKTIIGSVRDGSGMPWNKKFWCCKTFPPLIIANGLKRLFPAAKFIYIIRNGLDVVQSMTKFHGFHDREFQRNCASWSEGVETYRYLLSYDAATQVRHEELVSQPENILKQLSGFLGVPDHEGPSKFLKTTLVHPLDMPNARVASAKAELLKREPPYAQWSPEQKEVFRSVCGAAMGEAGYEMPF